MKSTAWFWFPFALALANCQRRLPPADIKANLAKTMKNYIQNTRRPGTPLLKFDILKVGYSEEASYYKCEFTVKLHRPDGSDTTGIIRGRISSDFQTVLN